MKHWTSKDSVLPMRVFTKRFAHTFILMFGLSSPTIARGGSGPIPVNPQERAFFNYLSRVANIRFGDSVQPDPWLTCESQGDGLTFFSASLFQFTSNSDIEQNVRAWVSGLFDHAYWAGIRSATCTFDINHFNECFARGSFSLYFRNNRVVSFSELTNRTWCESD